MNKSQIKQLAGFYENELVNKFLAFWLPRCVDSECGGFVNCFDNRGEKLVSYDKYVWSQGRFVWVFSKLASTTAPIFSEAQKAEFLALAKHGVDFLMEHCLMGEDDWRCIFLLDREGNPKYVDGCDRLDMSVYADCFVVAGLSKYASVSGDEKVYAFAKKLFKSITARIVANDFQTLPYPLSKHLRAHGIPMILCNVARDVYFAAEVLEPEYAPEVKYIISRCSADILDNFVDEDTLLHEIIMAEDNSFFNKRLGMHINPGHTLEDAWFHLDAAEIMGEEWNDYRQKVYAVSKQALAKGWDEEFGGILHFAALEGGKPDMDNSGFETETMSKQLDGWGDKLWWVHSEALYTCLRCYFETGDEFFNEWHEKLFDYVYTVYPNRDPEVREWMQILDRESKPMDAVVALPVKDPYHVMINLILIVELLHAQLA